MTLWRRTGRKWIIMFGKPQGRVDQTQRGQMRNEGEKEMEKSCLMAGNESA